MIYGWRILAAAAAFMAVPTAAMAARGVATNDVNLHAGPGTGYPVVDTIPAGAHVDIHGCLNDDSWCDVSWDQDRGWVASAYLEYFYNRRFVYLPDYYDVIGVPVVSFSLGTYWGDYYTGRPWFHRRVYWTRYWHHHHPHFVRNPNRPEHRFGANGHGRFEHNARQRGEFQHANRFAHEHQRGRVFNGRNRPMEQHFAHHEGGHRIGPPRSEGRFANHFEGPRGGNHVGAHFANHGGARFATHPGGNARAFGGAALHSNARAFGGGGGNIGGRSMGGGGHVGGGGAPRAHGGGGGHGGPGGGRHR